MSTVLRLVSFFYNWFWLVLNIHTWFWLVLNLTITMQLLLQYVNLVLYSLDSFIWHSLWCKLLQFRSSLDCFTENFLENIFQRWTPASGGHVPEIIFKFEPAVSVPGSHVLFLIEIISQFLMRVSQKKHLCQIIFSLSLQFLRFLNELHNIYSRSTKEHFSRISFNLDLHFFINIYFRKKIPRPWQPWLVMNNFHNFNRGSPDEH